MFTFLLDFRGHIHFGICENSFQRIFGLGNLSNTEEKCVESYLPAEKRTQSIAMFMVYTNTLADDVGRFRINDQKFIDFHLPQESISLKGGLSSIHFLLPSDWFKDENNIYFEHLSGDGATIEMISLGFDESGQSPYATK